MSEIAETASSSKNAVLSALTRKLGPFPGWVWVALIAILVWAVYLRTRGSRTVSPSNGYVNDVLDNSSAPSGAGPATEPVSTYDGINQMVNGAPLTGTNSAWAKQVVNHFTATGEFTAGEVSTAVSNYLSGKALSSQQSAIVNKAIAAFGAPPDGVLPVKLSPAPAAPKPVAKPPAAPAPKPVPKPAAKPPAKPQGQWYTVRRGDSLSAIAARYYGQPNWQKLWGDAGNRKRIGTNNPNLIHPGVKLWIPGK